MADCVFVSPDGSLTSIQPQPASPADCVGFLILSPAEFPNYAPADPATVAEMFTFGFSLVLASFWISFAVGAVRKTVRDAR